MEFSIIIPTFFRAKILAKCLGALEEQNFGKNNFEVIVVNDGGADETEDVVKKFQKDGEMAVKYFYQANNGQGNARNLGIKAAQGNIIVFIGDDVIVAPNFLKEHSRTHSEYPNESAACLGFIDWHPDINVTPFMKWLTNGSSVLGKFGGHQFAYEKLTNKSIADYNFFYTSNISLKKSLLQREMFDERFKFYGWEDIELGYRLSRIFNLEIHFNPFAKAFHLHEILEDSMSLRMEMIGRGIHLIDSIHPELNKKLSKQKILAFKILSSTLSLAMLNVLKSNTGGFFYDLYYYAISKKYFLKGYFDGLKNKNILKIN